MQQLNQTKDAVHADTYIFAYMTIIHEYNAHGGHRLRIHDRAYKMGKAITTEWRGYEDIVTYADEGTNRIICATTEYYEGVLPRVFRTEAAERL